LHLLTLSGTQALAMEDVDNNVTANGKRQNEAKSPAVKVRYSTALT